MFGRLEYLNKKVVVIKADRKSKYQETLHMVGIVKNATSGSEIGVLIDGLYNEASNKGLYWFKPYELKFVDEYNNENGGFRMEGNFKIAIVNLYDDSYKKDYGFVLFEDAKEGDMVVVNPRGFYSLGTIKSIIRKEDYTGLNVTKEVVSVVDMDTYKSRIKDRERAAQLEKEKKELQKELDKKISKLKDLEFYERMAKELGNKDPEIAEMVKKLSSMTA
jgi:hypothetical protein